MQQNWTLDEDAAMKAKLSGFSIPNVANPGQQLPVPVYFRAPDDEIRTRSFPHLAIDLTDITFAPERAHRAMEYVIDGDLELATPLTGFTLVGDDYPLPWNLIYQLSCYSRSPLHDRQFAIWMFQAFPEQYGSLDMSNWDGTVRRADLVDMVQRDTIEGDGQGRKRLYRKIFTVSVSSEFFLNQIRTIQQATSINIDYTSYFNEPVPA